MNKKIKLNGKFHSHITISSKDIKKAENLLKSLNIGHKITVIELSNFKNKKQEDAMITQHFHTRKWQNYKNIENFLKNLVIIFEQHNIKVIRLKIEHEDVDYNPSDCCYIESHIKVEIPLSQRENFLLKVKNIPELNGFVPSRNPNEIKGIICHQFLNKRWYDGSYTDLKNDIEKATSILNDMCNIKEIKIESAVFDSNTNLDRWWA